MRPRKPSLSCKASAKRQGEREAATATILALTIALQAATVQHAQAQQPALHLGGDVLGRFCWN